MRKTLALLAACLLAGCAGTPVGDALIGPEKLAQQDDAYCRSIGAAGPNYPQLSAVYDQGQSRPPYPQQSAAQPIHSNAQAKSLPNAPATQV